MVYLIPILKVFAVFSVIALWIYGQYFKAGKAEAKREPNSEIQTLLSKKSNRVR